MEWVLGAVGVIAVAYGIYKRRNDKKLVKQLLVKAATAVILLIIINAIAYFLNH